MKTLSVKDVNQRELFGYLTSAIGPRPIAFASTIDKKGNPNLAPFSFFNIFSSNPPILVFSPSRSGRTNTTKHTHDNVKEVAEVVINVATYDIVQQVSLASSPYEKGINEFIKAGLTPIKSDLVKPFRVKESPVQIECKVNDIIELGNQGGAGNLIISEILKVHIDESVLDENGKIDPFKLNLVGRMGGNWYIQSHPAAMFEITKPIVSKGIGFDNLPEDIKLSNILTANNLAQLASIEALPNETEVNEYKLIELSDIFVQYEDDAPTLELKLHELAKELLIKDELSNAWMTLLAFNNQ